MHKGPVLDSSHSTGALQRGGDTQCGKSRTVDSSFAQELLTRTAALFRELESFWTQEERIESVKWIQKNMGAEWSIEVLYDKFGKENVSKRLAAIIEERVSLLSTLTAIKQLDAAKAVCHICGQNPPVSAYDFGIAKFLRTRKKWGATIASIAFSAVAVPLLGGAYFVKPGTQTTASIVRLSLMLCASCRDARKRRSSRIKLEQQDYEKHPAVAKGKEAGYTEILSAGELSDYH